MRLAMAEPRRCERSDAIQAIRSTCRAVTNENSSRFQAFENASAACKKKLTHGYGRTTVHYIEANPYDWPHDGKLSPETTALLIIDMQRDFCEPGGYVDQMGYSIDGIRSIIPNIRLLREWLSAWGALVIHTREGHRPDLTDLPRLKLWRSRRMGIGIGAKGPLGRLLIRGEPGWEIIPELSVAPGEIVIDKPAYSAFHATDLDQVLRARGITRLILTGTTTDVCVSSTLRDAVDRGYECLTVADGCAATDRANHEAALRTIETEGGIFGAVTEVSAFAELGSGRGGAVITGRWGERSS